VCSLAAHLLLVVAVWPVVAVVLVVLVVLVVVVLLLLLVVVVVVAWLVTAARRRNIAPRWRRLGVIAPASSTFACGSISILCTGRPNRPTAAAVKVRWRYWWVASSTDSAPNST
jgi:hypothetical protein